MLRTFCRENVLDGKARNTEEVSRKGTQPDGYSILSISYMNEKV